MSGASVLDNSNNYVPTKENIDIADKQKYQLNSNTARFKRAKLTKIIAKIQNFLKDGGKDANFLHTLCLLKQIPTRRSSGFEHRI